MRIEQLYHLIQNKLLPKDDQDKYFSEVINPSSFGKVHLTEEQKINYKIKD